MHLRISETWSEVDLMPFFFFFLAAKFHSLKKKQIGIIWIFCASRTLTQHSFLLCEAFFLQAGQVSLKHASGEGDPPVEMPDTKWHLDDLKHYSCLHCMYKEYTKVQIVHNCPLQCISIEFTILLWWNPKCIEEKEWQISCSKWR